MDLYTFKCVFHVILGKEREKRWETIRSNINNSNIRKHNSPLPPKKL